MKKIILAKAFIQIIKLSKMMKSLPRKARCFFCENDQNLFQFLHNNTIQIGFIHDTIYFATAAAVLEIVGFSQRREIYIFLFLLVITLTIIMALKITTMCLRLGQQHQFAVIWACFPVRFIGLSCFFATMLLFDKNSGFRKTFIFLTKINYNLLYNNLSFFAYRQGI